MNSQHSKEASDNLFVGSNNVTPPLNGTISSSSCETVPLAYQ